MRYEILKSYDRNNLLLGININSVPDKNGQTFTQGRDPFDFLGFIVSADGKKLTYYEHDGVDWKTYGDLPPKATKASQGRKTGTPANDVASTQPVLVIRQSPKQPARELSLMPEKSQA